MAACCGSIRHYAGEVTASIEGGAAFSIVFDDGCHDGRVERRCVSEVITSCGSSHGGSSSRSSKSKSASTHR